MRTSTSFLLTKLDTIHRENVLKHQLITPLYDEKTYKRSKDIKIYKSAEIINDTISNGSTLLGVLYKVNDEVFGFGLFLEQNGCLKVMKLNIFDHMGYHLNHLWFAPIEMGELLSIEGSNLSSIIFDYVMIVPLNVFDDDKIRYTFLGKSWQVRYCDGRFSLPTISSHCLEQL